METGATTSFRGDIGDGDVLKSIKIIHSNNMPNIK